MADINNPVKYQKNSSDLIKKLLSDPAFSHKNWSDDELAELRKTIRDHYRNEQRGVCAFCRQAISLASVGNCHVEHIIAKSRYREFIFEPKNLCVICSDCNTIKRDKEVQKNDLHVLHGSAKIKRYPRYSNAFLIVHPHFDIWEDHIVQFGKLYADLTEKGLFTIGACTLNRALRKFGWEAIITSEDETRRLMQEILSATDTVIIARKMQALKRLLVST